MDNKTLNSWERLRDSDIYFSFIKSPTAIVSSVILLIIFFCSFFVEFVTPHNPFDPASLSLGHLVVSSNKIVHKKIFEPQ